MKKIILSLIVLTIILSCNKDEKLIKPLSKSTTQPIVTTSYSQKLIGQWICYDWIADEIMQTKKQRIITLFENTTNLGLLSNLDQHNLDSTFQVNIIMWKQTITDSTYFNIDMFPLAFSHKGYLMTDTTMMVYSYDRNSIFVVDTFQVDTFFLMQ